MGILPSEVGNIPINDFNMMKYMYDSKKLIWQRLEYQVGYLAYIVAILFSKDARKKSLNDFMIYEEKIKHGPADISHIMNKCKVLFRNKGKDKQYTKEEMYKLDNLVHLQNAYDGV